MFSHLFINRLKVLLRTKEMIFWSLFFPLALATFFYLAFSNLYSDDMFDPVDIAIVNNQITEQLNPFLGVLDSISQDDNKVFNITYLKSEKEAKEYLEDNKVAGYYLIDGGGEVSIVVKMNGLGQTIMKSVLDNYYVTISVTGNIYAINPEAFTAELALKINADKTYFNDTSNTNIDFTVIYFYTLIGLTCINAGTFGIRAANESEANLSKRGARGSVSPVHKLKSLLISLLVSFIIQYIGILILLAYLILILGVNFGSQLPWLLLLTFVGTISGITAGTLVGVSNRKNEEVKVSLFTAFTMLFSFCSGMMIWQMKYIIENNIPLLNRINPVAMITDALYALYYYPNLDRYFTSVICLTVFSLIMILLSYFFIRRKKYDSI